MKGIARLVGDMQRRWGVPIVVKLMASLRRGIGKHMAVVDGGDACVEYFKKYSAHIFFSGEI